MQPIWTPQPVTPKFRPDPMEPIWTPAPGAPKWGVPEDPMQPIAPPIGPTGPVDTGTGFPKTPSQPRVVPLLPTNPVTTPPPPPAGPGTPVQHPIMTPTSNPRSTMRHLPWESGYTPDYSGPGTAPQPRVIPALPSPVQPPITGMPTSGPIIPQTPAQQALADTQQIANPRQNITNALMRRYR